MSGVVSDYYTIIKCLVFSKYLQPYTQKAIRFSIAKPEEDSLLSSIKYNVHQGTEMQTSF